jgi:hypothetical protein
MRRRYVITVDLDVDDRRDVQPTDREVAWWIDAKFDGSTLEKEGRVAAYVRSTASADPSPAARGGASDG